MKLRTRTIERLRDALIESGQRSDAVLSPAYATLARKGLLTSAERMAVGRVEPIAEVLYLVMAADGELSALESDAVRGAIRGLSGNILNDGIIEVMLESFSLRLEMEGQRARASSLAELLSHPREREAAFALAAAVALADDKLMTEESSLIELFAQLFALDDADRRRILGELAEEQQAESMPPTP